MGRVNTHDYWTGPAARGLRKAESSRGPGRGGTTFSLSCFRTGRTKSCPGCWTW